MKVTRRLMAVVLVAALALPVLPRSLQAETGAPRAEEVLRSWYRLMLELVRHTPTYSPPVASRAFAYIGVTAFEALASGRTDTQSLAGQLNALQPVPQREAGTVYDETIVVNAAVGFAARNFFSNTGPTGQRALKAMQTRTREKIVAGVAEDIVIRSEAYGTAVAGHVLAWSLDDGGAVIDNMGFPMEYTVSEGPAAWVPTSRVAQQQAPLLPNWGNNRPFAMPAGATCDLPPPPEYSEDKASVFYKEAFEVYEAVNRLTPEHREIARFWSDDPMLSPTPPGHWISITLDILEKQAAPADRSADVLARLGISLADAFIGCWHSKFHYNLVRPSTYIRRVIDAKWEPLLITPPFPEYPSGHSTQSGAAAEVLSDLFGENFAFDDRTHEADGLRVRSFPGFWAAAGEAGISRLYGGIHFRAAIERGLDQGRCIAAYVTALKTRR